MINEKNLNKMYDGILNDQELTTKELNGYGFNSKDLSDLIKKGTLERIKRGYYSIKNIDALFNYGKKLIFIKKYNKATKCFEKCYELDPNHSRACFQLFLRSIQNRNYEKAFEYFDCIYDTDNKYYKADSNYYLYLLSMITKLPKKYREYAKSLKLEDIKVDFNDKRYNDIPAQNKVRLSSLNQRFILASSQLNELIKKNGRLSVQDIIIRNLLNYVMEEQYKIKRRIIALIKQKQYGEVIECLERLQEYHNLSLSDKYTLFLTKDLVQIIETGVIPKKQILSTYSLFNAIDCKNYKLALSLSSQYNKKDNIENRGNTIHLLLTEIQDLIDKKNNISEPVEQQKIQEIKSIVVEEKEQQIVKTKALASSNNTFADVTKYLIKNDLNNAFITLKNYLDSIGKKQYEFLIIDLIKISLIEKDVAFTKPMIVLTNVSRENFEFNILEYIQDFYETLAQNEFDKARIYLDIIYKLNNLEKFCIFTEGLEELLNNTEKMFNKRKDNEISNNLEQPIQNIKDTPISVTTNLQYIDQTTSVNSEVTSEQSVTKEDSIQKAEQTINKTDIVQSKNKDYDDNEFINQKLDELYEKGMILLKPMDSDRREEIHNIVKNIPDIVSFDIGSDNSKQIVLRFKPNDYAHIDKSELLKKAKESYINGDYDACINVYKQILKIENPKTFVYAYLGLAYMKKFETETAIDYLTVATELSKNENQRFDFTELINSLNGLIADDDKKPYVKMAITDFKNDVDENYGIKQVEQIEDLVSSGMTIDDACLNLSLDDEEKNIITLIFARKCYVKENYKIGDQYLKKVEKQRNKSKFTTSLLEEVRKNKKFYKYRAEEKQKSLTLTSEEK